MKYFSHILYCVGLLILFGCEQDWLMEHSQPDAPGIEAEGQLAAAFEFPYLAACSYLPNLIERRKCSDLRLLQEFVNNVQIPAKAHDFFSLVGTIGISFTISEEGSIENPEIINDIDPVWKESFLRSITKFSPFVPAKRYGRSVEFRYRFPVRIRWE